MSRTAIADDIGALLKDKGRDGVGREECRVPNTATVLPSVPAYHPVAAEQAWQKLKAIVWIGR